MEKLEVIVTFHTVLSYISIATALFTGALQSYVYQVDHWSNGTQDLYCLNDYHDEIPDSIKQRKNLLELADDGASLLIVEDMAGYEGDNPVLKRYITSYNSAKPSEQFLLHISTQARGKSISACNVEFRQPTVGGIEGAQLSAKDVLDLVEAVEQEARVYNDGEPFNSYYKSVLAEWDKRVGIPMKKWFTPIRTSEQLFCKAVHSLPYTQKIEAILTPYQVDALPESAQKNLVCKLYNSELLDIRIIHALAQGQKYKTVYLCAGSGHIKRINSFLSEAGYTYLTSYVESEHKQGIDLAHTFSVLQRAAKSKIPEPLKHEPVQTLPGWLVLIFIFLLTGSIAYKKRRVLFCLILLLSTFVGQTVMAYVTEMHVWANGKQSITCLSDIHNPTTHSSEQTQDFINHILKDKKNNLVLLEDMSDYRGSDKRIKQSIDNFSTHDLHFLRGLTKACEEAGITTCNIEWRHTKCAAERGEQISGSEVYQVSDEVRKEIACYNDGPLFNQLYKRYDHQLKTIKEQCSSLVNQFKGNTDYFVDVLDRSIYTNDLDQVLYEYFGYTPASLCRKKKLILTLYDAPLLERRILHEIAQHPNKKNIFICAGKWHIDNLASSFEGLGYTKMWSTQSSQAVKLSTAFKSYSKECPCNETMPIQTSRAPLGILLVLLCIATIPLVVSYTRKKWLYSLLLLCTSSSVLPYVHSTSTWKNGDQFIHLYSDDHYPHPISETQQKYLINNAKQSKSVIIVEDMKTYSGTNTEVKRATEAYCDYKNSFLMNLTKECVECGIPVVNVEFRQPSNASLSGYNVSAREVLCLSDELKEVLKTYDDGPEFNQWYAQVLKKLEYYQEKYEPFFKQLRGKQQTLCALLPKTKYYSCLDKALKKSMQYVDSNVAAKKNDLITMYDAALIDILIVHALAQHEDMQDVYICAGGWHIANLEDAFDSFGYQNISSQEGSIAIGGTQEDLPHAIDFACTYDASQSTASDSLMLGYMLLFLIGIIVTGLFFIGRYKFALILLSTLSGSIQAHVYKIDKWTTQDQSHNLFTLRDFHTSRLPMNHKGNEQRDAIVKLGKERKAYIIAEDIYPDTPALFKDPINYDPNRIGPMEDKTPFKDKTTPLLALTPACSEHGVKFDNIEFRQVGYVSDMGHIITPADCVRSADRIATEIKRYDDTETLNKYYVQQLKKYNTMRSQAQSFFDYLLTITDKTTKELFEEESVPFSSGIDSALKTFGWSDQRIVATPSKDKMIALLRYYTVPLVDAKLAHAIFMHKSNPNLIVCAGFKHIEAIQDILPAIGYTYTGTQGKELLEENLPEPTALDIKDSFMTLDPHPILPSHDTSSGVLLIVAVLFGLGLALPIRRRKST